MTDLILASKGRALVYIASPIDLGEVDEEVGSLVEELSRMDAVVYAPALLVGHLPTGAIFLISDRMLKEADVILALLPRGIPTIGTVLELAYGIFHRKAVAVWTVGTDLTETLQRIDAPVFQDRSTLMGWAQRALNSAWGWEQSIPHFDCTEAPDYAGDLKVGEDV